MATRNNQHPGRRGLSTIGVHGGGAEARPGAPVVPPLVQSSTFFGGDGQGGDLLYSRYGNNPTQLHVALKLAELEGTEAAVVLGSGMAATAMAVLALARAGDHVVASNELYGTTRTLLDEELPRRGIDSTLVDPGVGRTWREALRTNTRLLWLEVPTNPTLRVHDPRPVAQLAREKGLTLVVDATFASPVNLLPVDLGADVVVHSATKYLGGHSDLIAGVVAGPQGVVDEVTRMMKLYGPAVDPFAAWLLDRGLRTLDVRVERQNATALSLARWLEEQPGVARVLHPGLESHPDHEVARDILSGFGGMISFILEGGGPAADDFTAALELAAVAPSLGGVETLVSQPRYTSHLGLSPAEREELGIPDGFVRISVGVEDEDDLREDLAGALGAIA